MEEEEVGFDCGGRFDDDDDNDDEVFDSRSFSLPRRI